MIRKVFLLFFLCLTWQMTFAQSPRGQWVDSIHHELSASEKVGQLFLVPVSGETDERTIHEIENLIKSHEIGGLIFKNLPTATQARMANHFQSLANVPLLIAVEGDVTSILDSAMLYPTPHILGAVRNDSLLYQLGAAVARQLQMVGVNVLFSPSTRIAPTGVNPNPDKTAFGQTKEEVARKALAIMSGLQDNGILACAQYFPLQGITVLDVRKDFPLIDISVDSVQSFPHRSMMAKGLKGISPAAAEFPVFYKDMSAAKRGGYSSSSLSQLFTAGWVRKNTGYQGLIFVDISQIESVSSKARDGDVEMQAFQTGNDVLMNPKEIGPAIRRIKKLLRKEENYEAQLDHTVRKILSAKFDAGLWKGKIVNTDNLELRVNNVQAQILNQKLYESAVTIVKNQNDLLPIRVMEDRRFGYLSMTPETTDHLLVNFLKKYAGVESLTLLDPARRPRVTDVMRNLDVLFVGILPETTPAMIRSLDSLLSLNTRKPEIVICDFGNSNSWQMLEKSAAFVTAYTAVNETLRAVPQIIFGALPASGKLSFTPTSSVAAGTGIVNPSINRLAYSLPEEAGMNSTILNGIDSIAAEAMRIGATPGCQVIVARKGKVVFERNYGKMTYEGSDPVTSNTIYDLASVTKVMATLQTAMFMHERGLLDLNKKVSHYLPELRNTNKKDITLMDMLTHQSGLVPFLPMYNQTMKDTSYLPHYYSRVRNARYPMQVGATLFASPVLRDSVWSWVVKSKMLDKPARTPFSYRYSDFGFLILQRLAETLLNQPMDDFLSQNLYEPLGAYTTGFNPLNRFSKHNIAPTEDDKIYRRSFVAGTVHDERAAMMGGVAGHAGLFSTANDLVKVGQMLLQEGSYGGVRYYKPETVRLFTAKKYRNSRRGIGWDKPIPSDPGTLTSFYASPSTYGHTGFTGTCIWIDPEFDLVYIFLSNRVYPDRNNKLSNANIRSRIQDVIYKSVFGFVEEESISNIPDQLAINDGASRP